MWIKIFIEGWINFFLDKISVIKYRKEFAARMEICNRCESNKKGICGECHCVLAAKTKAEESACPLKKWGPVGNKEKE